MSSLSAAPSKRRHALNDVEIMVWRLGTGIAHFGGRSLSAIRDKSREGAEGLGIGGARIKEHPALRLAAVVGSLLAITILHNVIPHSSLFWHNFFQRLYYLPIVYAATQFGLRGALATAAFATIGYIPHLVTPWAGDPHYIANQFVELLVLFLVSGVTGVLADREHDQSKELEQATSESMRMHADLQASFVQLGRLDRLSTVGQLAASLAHEIQSPLGRIRAAISVMEQPRASEELREVMNKECGRLEALLTSLLDHARPHPPEYRQVDIRHLFHRVCALVSSTAARNGVRIRTDIALQTPALECDPEQLTQMLLNLALNAVQAMPAGGELLLATRPNDSQLRIQVRDQGVGIAESDLSRIFEPFFTTKSKGTGLGLSVTHRIVSQHRGSIRAERNTDQGMTFSVHLPFRAGGSG